jgi:hypothetical protein
MFDMGTHLLTKLNFVHLSSATLLAAQIQNHLPPYFQVSHRNGGITQIVGEDRQPCDRAGDEVRHVSIPVALSQKYGRSSTS